MHRKRHAYRSLTAEQREGEIHLYSFTLEDAKFAKEINRKLYAAQIEHRDFWFRYIETKTKHVFQIHAQDIVEDDLKKILFMVGLKSKSEVNKR